MLTRRNVTLVMFALTIGRVGLSDARAGYLGPTPYLNANENPFQGSGFIAFHLEDFEDGSLNTPGVTASNGFVIPPASLTDSVDGDDGSIDGSGTRGHSFYSNATTLTFTFSADALGGALPTDVGIVWTDVGTVNGGTFGVADVIFEAFDANGASLGISGPFLLGDGQIGGQTGEDRFLGVTDPAGISRITIFMPSSSDWEVDHLQYGIAIPEPTSLTLLGSGLAAMALRHHRRRPKG